MGQESQDVIDYDNNALETIVDQNKESPERLVVGAQDPLSTAGWEKVFGKDWDSTINEFGGPSAEADRRAVEGGIDVNAGRNAHGVARAIAAYYGVPAALGGISEGISAGSSALTGAGTGATGGDAVAQTGLGEVGSSMPAAVPETPATLNAQGLVEKAPGVFAAPGAAGYVGAPGGVPATAPAPSSEGVDPGSAPLQAPGAPAPAAPGVDAAAGTSVPGLLPEAAPAPPPPSTPPTPTAPPVTNLPASGADPSIKLGTDPQTLGQGPANTAQDPGMVEKVLRSIGIMGKGGGIGPSALPLALTVGSTLNNQRKGDQTQRELRAIAAGPKAASDRLLAEGASGNAPPAIIQQMEKSYNDKVAEITQRYANMGRDPSTDSAAQAEIARARDAKDAALTGYSTNLTQQGLQAAQVAAGPQTQAAIAGAQSDKDLQAAMANGLQTLAMMQAFQGRGP